MTERRSREAVGDGSYKRMIRDALYRKQIGVTRRGTPVYMIAGGSEGQSSDGGSGEGGSGGTEGGAEGEGSGTPEGEGEGSGESGGEGEAEKETEKSRKRSDEMAQRPGEDRGAYRARMARRAAEERAEKAERELEELRDKDRSDTQRLEARATKAEKRVTALEPTVRRLSIENAFLKASFGDGNKRKAIQWVDAGDVLLLVQRELADIKIGDDGDIDEDDVRAVVDDIAKRKSHLVRKEKKEPETPSGGNVGSSQRTPQEASLDELRRKFPAMASRTPRQ